MLPGRAHRCVLSQPVCLSTPGAQGSTKEVIEQNEDMDTEKEKKKALSISTACKNTVTEGQGEKQKFRNKMEVM